MTATQLHDAAGEDTRRRASLDACHALAPRGQAVVFDRESLALVTDGSDPFGALPWARLPVEDTTTHLAELFADEARADLDAAIARARVTSMTRAGLLSRNGIATMVMFTTFGADVDFALAIVDSAIDDGLADSDAHIRTRIVCDRQGNVINVDGSLGSWAHLGAAVGRWSERIVAAHSRPDLHSAVAQVLAGEPYARTKVEGAAPGLRFEAFVAPQGPERLVIDFYDESHERQAITALGRLQTQFAKLSETLPVGVFVTGEGGRMEFHSQKLREMFGPAISSEFGWIEIVHEDDRPLLESALSALPHRHGFNVEVRGLRADGTTGLFRLAGSDVRNDEGRLVSVVGFVEDITEQRELYRRIEFQASFDGLTELPNRSAVLEQLRTSLEDEPTGRRTGVLFIDLDGFKLINDTQGHSVGDIVLVEIAHRFRRAVGSRDVIGRLGGDEFIVVAPDIDGPEDAQRLAQRLHDILSTPVLAHGRIISVSASIGIALSDEGMNTSEQLVGDADIAMYEAKNAGRNRTVVFDAPLRSRASQRFDMTADLRHARRRRELRLEYQPIIDLDTNELVGAEGLVRWEHPAMGRISPDVFIPLAEEIGLISDIGEWVVEQACADFDRLRATELIDEDFVISINASANQFNNVATLATSCLATLDQYGLQPKNLRFELTESIPLTQIPEAASRIRQLTSYGFGLAIDDFGTGYSSLGYLTMLPFDVLKLDLSLVAQLSAGSPALAVVDSLTRMSHEMGFTIVAEGIERPDQQRLLHEAGVQLGQGYHISRPLTMPALMDLLQADVDIALDTVISS